MLCCVNQCVQPRLCPIRWVKQTFYSVYTWFRLLRCLRSPNKSCMLQISTLYEGTMEPGVKLTAYSLYIVRIGMWWEKQLLQIMFACFKSVHWFSSNIKKQLFIGMIRDLCDTYHAFCVECLFCSLY